MILPLDMQTASSTLRAGSRSLDHAPGPVRPSERDLQLSITLEWHTCTADGRVGLEELHLQSFVLQVWRRAPSCLLVEAASPDRGL